MKISHGLYVAAAVVLLADVVSGYQSASNGGVAPKWFSGTLGAIESNVPFPLPLWMVLAGTGVAIHYTGR